MALGVRIEPELERRLDQLAQQLGKTRSACFREAITLYLSRHGDAAEARRQSEHLAQAETPHWSERGLPWRTQAPPAIMTTGDVSAPLRSAAAHRAAVAPPPQGLLDTTPAGFSLACRER